MFECGVDVCRVLPKHVAIVMDGNGRWAKARQLARISGHRAGFETARRIVRVAHQSKLDILSLFAFSTENWFRPSFEVNALMQLFSKAFDDVMEHLAQAKIQIKFIGQIERLDPFLIKKMQAIETETGKNTGMILQLAVSYGGRWDIVAASKKLARACLEKKLDLEQISESTFSKALSFGHLPDPDLLIRTGDELRISNFFLWQNAYTELFFSKKYWPDFTSEDFLQALAVFSKRRRRFGTLAEGTLNPEEETAC